jgi:hypothetical protein
MLDQASAVAVGCRGESQCAATLGAAWRFTLGNGLGRRMAACQPEGPSQKQSHAPPRQVHPNAALRAHPAVVTHLLKSARGKTWIADSVVAKIAGISAREVLELRFPPGPLSTNYLLALEDYFFVYPTKLREYQARYRGAFLHGGASPDEMILPVALLRPR